MTRPVTCNMRMFPEKKGGNRSIRFGFETPRDMYDGYKCRYYKRPPSRDYAFQEGLNRRGKGKGREMYNHNDEAGGLRPMYIWEKRITVAYVSEEFTKYHTWYC